MVVTKGRYMFRVDLQIIPVFSDGSGGKQSKGVHDDGYEDWPDIIARRIAKNNQQKKNLQVEDESNDDFYKFQALKV